MCSQHCINTPKELWVDGNLSYCTITKVKHLELNQFQIDTMLWGGVSAAVEQSSFLASRAAQGDK